MTDVGNSPATKRDLLELEERVDAKLDARLAETERRLAFQIGDAASRTANAIIERFTDLIGVVDDRVSGVEEHANAGHAAVDRRVDELRDDFDAHCRDGSLHGKRRGAGD